MFNESMNDFYKNLTFYKAAKSYAPELKKQIIAFLRKKGIKGYQGEYSFQPSFSYDNLPTDKKEKRSLFRDIYKNLEIDDKTGDRYQSKLPTFKKISFPPFNYDDFTIKAEINNNETFFEDGHDLSISLNKIDGGYETSRKFEYKLNLLRNIYIVLEDFWSLILKSIEEYPLTEKPQYSQNREYKVPTSPEPEVIVKKWLGTYYKEYKSGKKVEIDDVTKQPAEFFITQNKSDRSYSSTGRGSKGFTLNFKIRLLSRNFTTSGYRTSLNPELKNRYPQYKEWLEILNGFYKDMGFSSYQYMDEEKLFGEKSYSDEHLKVFEKLKIVVKRLFKMGYFPTEAHSAYGRDDYSKIEFKYYPQLPEKIRLNPSKIDSFLSSKEFRDRITSTFFYAGQHPNNIMYNIITSIFNTQKR